MDQLPAYIYCNQCPLRHFLTLNKDIQGKWTICYTSIKAELVIEELWDNEQFTIEEAAEAMLRKLKTYGRSNNFDTNEQER